MFCEYPEKEVSQFYPTGIKGRRGAKVWEDGKATTTLLGHAGAAALLGGDGDVLGPASLMMQMAPGENPLPRLICASRESGVETTSSSIACP